MNRQAKPRSRCRSAIRLSTDACTDTSSADVGSSATSSFGSSDQGPGEADPLALAAGQLVRVAVAQLGAQPDLVEHLRDAPRRRSAPWRHPVQPQRLGDDLADRHPRVQRGVRVLEDDVHVAPQRPQRARATGG